MRRLVYTSVVLISMSAVINVPAPAEAQTRTWSVSFDAGVNVPVSGDVIGSASGNAGGVPLEITARTYGDVYGASPDWSVGVGYRVRERGEIRVQTAYVADSAEPIGVGTVATIPVFQQFGDYEAFSLDVGYRQYLGSGRARPFVGAAAGFMRLGAISAQASVPALDLTLEEVEYLTESTVATVRAGGGLQVELTPRWAVHAIAEMRWHGDATDADRLADVGGIESVNDESRRWSLPITGGVTFRF
jgi:hypothetical protein